jgi:hypothetical protein
LVPPFGLGEGLITLLVEADGGAGVGRRAGYPHSRLAVTVVPDRFAVRWMDQAVPSHLLARVNAWNDEVA